MAARVGIRREQVVREAITLLDDTGRPEQVTLAAVARRLGIRTQSVYAHVDGAEALRRTLAHAGLEELAAVVTDAALGRSGLDALGWVVRAHLDLALSRPGLYTAAIHPPGDDPDLGAAVDRVSHPLEVILTDLGWGSDDRVHLQRILLASVYGYACLARDGQLTLDVDPTATADRLIGVMVDAARPVTGPAAG